MKTDFKILLVEDMPSFRMAVTQMLGVYNDIEEAESLAEARLKLSNNAFDVVLLDKNLPDGDGKDLIAEIKSNSPNAAVVMLTTDSDIGSIKHCLAMGADDYVIKSENIVPDLLVRIPIAVSKLLSRRRLNSFNRQVKEIFKYELVGKSKSIMELREKILELRGSESTVLITGESGTGKELIARRLNAIEKDELRPFVSVNCGAIPENLFESELFGHKKGAFTNATTDKEGHFEAANNGDIFLDEIGELPLSAQVKLLRVLQEGEVCRVGETRPRKVKCRIIAATNQNLESLVQAGKFREDLYHRLNVIRITTAPLRKRVEDIEDLSKLFLLNIGGPQYKINDHAIKALCQNNWPGNIRELRNVIERAILTAKRRSSFEISYDDILLESDATDALYKLRKIEACLPEKIEDLTKEKYQEFFNLITSEYFKSALEAAGGSPEEVARRIGVSRATVFNKLKVKKKKSSNRARGKIGPESERQLYL